MSVCKDCKHYNPTSEETGDCFGVEVRGDMDADDCPAKAFEPKQVKLKSQGIIIPKFEFFGYNS